jgi:site-specific DNA-methyltransferase (adenine-specific)
VKKRAPQNRTIALSATEKKLYKSRLKKLKKNASLDDIIDKTICQDSAKAMDMCPEGFVDLLIADPPYNLNKRFNNRNFSKLSYEKYVEYLDSWLSKTKRLLKANASIYICGDWRCSSAIQEVLSRYFIIRNRITWEREKGRGSQRNWKNACEDIWFATVSDEYTFNIESVKLYKKVIAPYKNGDGTPKDWTENETGKFRLTCPSNLWTDITIPFWSMPENTDHPTQKPEKLLAKLILASSNEGDVVFDPFLGSGSTSVAAYKLNRRYVGIEIDTTYCCLAEKRLEMAQKDSSIQGYINGKFYERNSIKKNDRDVAEDKNNLEAIL